MVKITTAEFVERANKTHNNKYTYPDEYTSANAKIRIICKNHMEFMQTARKHVNGANCPSCTKELANASQSKKISDYLKLATEKGVIFLDTEVPKNVQTPANWKCKNGHSWVTTYRCVARYNNCLTCANEVRNKGLRMPEEEFINKANKIYDNVYDYSKVNYINIATKVIIICKKENHGEFQLSPQRHIYEKVGCKICKSEYNKENNNIIKINHKINHPAKSITQFIEDARKIHENIYDYSKVIYINSHTKICIFCKKEDHGDFYQEPYTHLKGHGCPKCGTKTVSENLCRNIFQTLLGTEFLKVRPKFLNGLELDGFNKELKLAFEYDGEQHYEYIEHFFREGCDKFNAQVERDNRKIKLCKDNNINLIKIPYIYDIRTPLKLQWFIIKQILKLNYTIMDNALDKYNNDVVIKLNKFQKRIRKIEKTIEYMNTSTHTFKEKFNILRRWEDKYYKLDLDLFI